MIKDKKILTQNIDNLISEQFWLIYINVIQKRKRKRVQKRKRERKRERVKERKRERKREKL